MNYECGITNYGLLKLMKKDNIVQIKSYDFALLCVKLFQELSKNKKEYVLSKQILVLLRI